jgi:hypothetical protein
MFDVLVTVLVALFSFPYLHQENVTPSPLAILVVVALTVPLVVRRIWPSAVFGWLCRPARRRQRVPAERRATR